MREILFRAKTEPYAKDGITGKVLSKPKWIYGYLDLGYMQGDDGAIISDKKANHAYRCQSATIGQYTGVTDIHGKKIFEGDIVKHYNFSVDPEHFSSGVILWNDDACRWERTDTECSERFFISSECKYEVIGNIHDNPELMGGAENVSHP